MKKKEKDEAKILVDTILEALYKIKGNDICSINLKELPDAVCEYFIICHADSAPQIQSLADSVLETVKGELGETVWHKEGLVNAQWILLDYSNVVVHIFEKESRDFYDLEGLWADAEIVWHKDTGMPKGKG